MFDEKELRVAMVREQKTIKDIADMLEISQTTLYRKIKRDGDFSRKEIQKISEFLNLKEPLLAIVPKCSSSSSLFIPIP